MKMENMLVVQIRHCHRYQQHFELYENVKMSVTIVVEKKLKTAEQVMAPMPEIRLRTQLHAFARTAVDSGGPRPRKTSGKAIPVSNHMSIFLCSSFRSSIRIRHGFVS